MLGVLAVPSQAKPSQGLEALAVAPACTLSFRFNNRQATCACIIMQETVGPLMRRCGAVLSVACTVDGSKDVALLQRAVLPNVRKAVLFRCIIWV